MYFPATFRPSSAGILLSRRLPPAQLKPHRIMLARSDLEKDVSDMSTNGIITSINFLFFSRILIYYVMV